MALQRNARGHEVQATSSSSVTSSPVPEPQPCLPWSLPGTSVDSLLLGLGWATTIIFYVGMMVGGRTAIGGSFGYVWVVLSGRML